jgi:hypothetical protein
VARGRGRLQGLPLWLAGGRPVHCVRTHQPYLPGLGYRVQGTGYRVQVFLTAKFSPTPRASKP